MIRTKKKENEMSPGGQQLSWLKWKYCWRHIHSLFPAQLSHWNNVDIYIYNYLEQSTSFTLSIKISRKKKRSVICWYVEIHSLFLLNQSYNLELHLVKKRGTYTHTIEIECYLEWLSVGEKKRKVKDHHYRHHHCVYMCMLV
jgi:hypothetical protein